MKTLFDYIRNGNEQIRNIIFNIILTIETIIVIEDKSDLHFGYESYVFRLTFALSVVCVLLAVRLFSKKDILLIAVFSVLSIIVYRLSGRNELLRFTIFVAACKDLDIIRKLKIYFYEMLAGSALLILLSVTGIYGNLSVNAWDDAGSIRYVFGFGDANSFHCMFMMMVFLACYLYADKWKWYVYAIMAGLNIVLWMLTGCETAAAITMLGIGGAVLIKYTSLFKGVLLHILGLLTLGFSILFSVYAAVNSHYMHNKYSAFFDRLLSGRIVNLYWDTKNHAGSIETWRMFAGGDTMDIYFDMGWVRLFYWYGIIPAIFVLVAIILLHIECMNRKDSLMAMILMCLSIYTVVEAHLISVYIGRNYILFIMGLYLIGNINLKMNDRLASSFPFSKGDNK